MTTQTNQSSSKTSGEEANGQCLCGAVTFRISGPFERFFLCHCSRCRKNSGSAHSANLFSSSARLSWLSGEDRIRVFRVPETRHAKCFCIDCGSALPFTAGAAGPIVVPAGSLDSPVRLRPEAHLCVASRADWDKDLEAIPRLDGLPG